MMDKILTVPQIAEILQISKAKAYLIIQRGEIPYIKLERNIRVRESELLKYIDKQTIRPRI